MSEAINKLLCTHPQSFTTAEQKIGRDNISAQAKLTYAYSGSTITAIDGSAVGKISTYGYRDDTITSIDGSAVGNPDAMTVVQHDGNLSGSGTTGSPLGLNSSVSLNAAASGTYMEPGHLAISATHPKLEVYRDASASAIIDEDGFTFRHSANGIGGGVARSCYGETLSINYNDGDNFLKNIKTDQSGFSMVDNGRPDLKSYYGFGSALFSDNSGTTWEHCDASSIRRWNSGVSAAWNESGNSLSTGWGGNRATAASQYSYSGNWAARTVKMSGLPDQTMYGFQAKPTGSGGYLVNAAGAFVAPALPTFNLKVYKPTNATLYLGTGDYPPMPSTADGLLILVNMGSGPNVVYPDTDGATAFLSPHNSASLIWDSNTHSWVRWNN